MAELAREVLAGLEQLDAPCPSRRRAPARRSTRPFRSPLPPRPGGRRRGRRALTRPEPLSPDALADRLASLLARTPPPRRGHRTEGGGRRSRVRRAGSLAAGSLIGSPSRARRRRRATGFYRPASVRLEHGRTDPDARYTDWLDVRALARRSSTRWVRAAPGVAGPVGPRPGPCRPRPGRDAVGRRPGRARIAAAGRGPGVRRRGAPAGGPGRAAEARARGAGVGLPAYDRYDDEVDPAGIADAVVLADHADRPALVLQGRFVR